MNNAQAGLLAVTYSVIAISWGFFLQDVRIRENGGRRALPWIIASFWPIFMLSVAIDWLVDYVGGDDV